MTFHKIVNKSPEFFVALSHSDIKNGFDLATLNLKMKLYRLISACIAVSSYA